MVFSYASEKGMSLVSVLVGVAITGIIMTVIAQLTTDSIKTQNYFHQFYGTQNIRYELLNALSNPETCRVNFQGLNAKIIDTTVVNRITNQGAAGTTTNIIEIGGTYEQDSVSVQDIQFANFYPVATTGVDQFRGTVDLELHLAANKQSMGPREFGRTVKLVVELNGYTGSPGAQDNIDNCFSIGTNASSIWTLKSSGEIYFNGPTVGIGTQTPGQRLHVEGNILADAFYYPSDKTLKEEIAPLQNDKAILDLKAVDFIWKESKKKDMGFIAQEVERLFPHIVATHPSTGIKSVDYSRLVVPLVESHQRLHQRNQMLEEKVEKMAEDIRVLKKQMAL